MVEGGNISLTELDEMLPYEKDIYLQFMIDKSKRETEKKGTPETQVPTKEMFERGRF